MSQDLRTALEPLIKMVLEEERRNFISEMEPWESREAKIRAEFEAMAACYRDRLANACELIKKHVR